MPSIDYRPEAEFLDVIGTKVSQEFSYLLFIVTSSLESTRIFRLWPETPTVARSVCSVWPIFFIQTCINIDWSWVEHQLLCLSCTEPHVMILCAHTASGFTIHSHNMNSSFAFLYILSLCTFLNCSIFFSRYLHEFVINPPNWFVINAPS